MYNLEPKIHNTAMMQVSYYHKKKKDVVEIYNPLFHNSYDKIYAFSIFQYTAKSYVTGDMIKGGTGFDVQTKLPKEIESSCLDYSIFPHCKTSYIWFSRGCIRDCPFCIVRQKEGYIYPVKPKNLNPDGDFITVMDNNFFASPKWKESITQLKEWRQPVDFQGVDARLLTNEMCYELNNFTHYKQIKIAWDNPTENILPKLRTITKIIKPRKLMCYVLIGYWSTQKEDLFRVEKLRDLHIDPFVMPYDKKDRYQKDFARWVNNKAVFKTVKWSEYLNKNPAIQKEVKLSHYLNYFERVDVK